MPQVPQQTKEYARSQETHSNPPPMNEKSITYFYNWHYIQYTYSTYKVTLIKAEQFCNTQWGIQVKCDRKEIYFRNEDDRAGLC